MKRLVMKGVTVIRDGARVRPEIGKQFDFTKEEIDSLKGVDDSVLAMPSKESEDGAAERASATPSAEQSQAKASGGKKKATAAKSDAENAADGDGGDPPAGRSGGPGAGTEEPGVDTDTDDDL